MNEIKEKLITFKNKEREKLFGFLVVPKRKGKFPAVILIHGFAKTKTERKFVKLSRKLAKANIVSFRFDFSGCGDSEGEFEKLSISKQLEDLKAAFRILLKEKKVNKKRVGILAHSLGSVIACLFQAKYQKVKTLILVAPALNQKRLLKKWYKKSEIEKWGKQGYLDTPKGRIGIGYLRETRDYNRILQKIKIPILILHGKEDKDIPLKMTKETFKKLKTKEKRLIIIPECDHHFESYFGRQKLINLSVEWFKKYL
jgi:hypothetical protein